MIYEYKLVGHPKQIESTLNEIESKLNDNLPPVIGLNLLLCVEEALNSSFSYGKMESTNIEVSIEIDSEIKIVIKDDNDKVNQNSPVYKLSQKAIKRMVDTIHYEYKDNYNVLTLLKSNLL